VFSDYTVNKLMSMVFYFVSNTLRACPGLIFILYVVYLD
jgi:hypothetical protein